MIVSYVFWAFRQPIEGFRHHWLVRCVDGTHLYGKYTGKILIVTAAIANDTILPLAFAIIDEERIKSWSWFLMNLRQHVVPTCEGVTLIFDHHKTLLGVVARWWINPTIHLVIATSIKHSKILGLRILLGLKVLHIRCKSSTEY